MEGGKDREREGNMEGGKERKGNMEGGKERGREIWRERGKKCLIHMF